ncbi:hypothetical protein HRbin16_00989 [bacterium HR16]|nr:hypothetical protein HRbin16_00989 [bacterium HR16]
MVTIVVMALSLLIPFVYVLLPVVATLWLFPFGEVPSMLSGEPLGEVFRFALSYSMPLYTHPLLIHFAMGSGLVAYWITCNQEKKNRVFISLAGFGGFAVGGVLLSVIPEGKLYLAEPAGLVCSFQAVVASLMAYCLPSKIPTSYLKAIDVLSRAGGAGAAALAGYAPLWLSRYISPLHLSTETPYTLLRQALQHPSAVWIALLPTCLSTIIPAVLAGGFYPSSTRFEKGCAAIIAGGTIALLLTFHALDGFLTESIPTARWGLFRVCLVLLVGCIWLGAWLGIQLDKIRHTFYHVKTD